MDSGVKGLPRLGKPPSKKQPRKGSHDDGADKVRKYRPEKGVEGCERQGAAASGLAGIYRKDGHVVAADNPQDWQGEGGGRGDRAASRGPLVRARRRRGHL